MAARPSKRSPNALPSKVASSAKLLAAASRSRRFAASNALPKSSTRSGVVDSSVIVQGVSRLATGGDYAASGTARALASAHESLARIVRSAWRRTRSMPRARSGVSDAALGCRGQYLYESRANVTHRA